MKVRHKYGTVFAVALAIGAVSPLTSGSAFAQTSQTCSCLAAATAPGSVVGRLTQVRGDVQMSQAGGYAGVKMEGQVYPGSRILTGPQGSALLNVGANCTLNIPANAIVAIDPVEGGMCVSVSTPEAMVKPAGSGPGITPILLGGVAVGGTAALILSLHSSNAVSN